MIAAAIAITISIAFHLHGLHAMDFPPGPVG
jgi:hypothetical protein